MAALILRERPVSPERSGWRDEAISRWHRTIGFDCPAVDLDFVMIEYCWHEPKALVEYKNEHADIDIQASGIRVLKKLADMADLPAFIVKYASDLSWFDVQALNAKGAEWSPGGFKRLTEEEYRAFLYRLRGLRFQAAVVNFKGGKP